VLKKKKKGDKYCAKKTLCQEKAEEGIGGLILGLEKLIDVESAMRNDPEQASSEQG